MNNGKVMIIAEAGVNHNGSLKKAFELVDAAAAAGADYVKFQTFKASCLTSKSAEKASYQVDNAKSKAETQFQMLQKLELSESDHESIIEYCRSKKINFFSTAFDIQSLEYLYRLGLEIVKIPSGEITNLPYLKKASILFKNIILSTGMATLDEIKNAMDVFTNAGIPKSNITILHCNTEYPTPMTDVNLIAMLNIQKVFGTDIGYSDHTMGIEVPIAAVALGAKTIEKHFTLDRDLPGPDHKASLEPDELKAMVSAIRNIERAISGSGIKEPSPSELKNISIARKSIHLARSVPGNTILTESDLIALRPGDGISAMEWEAVIGKKLLEHKEAHHKLSWSDII